MIKNNETFNKYLAGLVDGDGCITTNFYKTRNKTYKARFHFSIVFDKSIHNVRKHIEEILDYFGVGQIYERKEKNIIIYQVSDAEKAISCVNRIKKHLVIKGQHAERMIDLFKLSQGYGNTYSEEEVKSVRKYVKDSRRNTTSIKPKKHLTLPWFAGYIDSDGYLSFKNRDMVLDFSCAKQDLPALQLISKAYGREITEGRDNEIRLRHYFSKKDATAAKRILVPILPHLRLKRWDAEQILASYTTRRD